MSVDGRLSRIEAIQETISRDLDSIKNSLAHLTELVDEARLRDVEMGMELSNKASTVALSAVARKASDSERRHRTGVDFFRGIVASSISALLGAIIGQHFFSRH